MTANVTEDGCVFVTKVTAQQDREFREEETSGSESESDLELSQRSENNNATPDSKEEMDYEDENEPQDSQDTSCESGELAIDSDEEERFVARPGNSKDECFSSTTPNRNKRKAKARKLLIRGINSDQHLQPWKQRSTKPDMLIQIQ